MKIENGTRVSLAVKIYDGQGALLQASDAPLTYRHGAGDIFARLEAALAGHSEGDSVSVWLEPQDAFGEDDASLLHVVARTHLGADAALGLQYEGVPGQAADGRIYTIVDLTHDVAVLDGNHPLAGRALRFDLTVRSIEQADDDDDADDISTVPSFLAVASADDDGHSRRH
jgi:FKBP-type peptidyl-prolyl cis-trans isomerase SlyD